ncbi:copper-binding transcription factor [Parelaphostrongylus tenuis]|uniref:Copper-binding transcription factor n=1 Tax=Parelaphostrongylus tenuis TaxID=148309 RepID=A0AAD5MEZ2_PARTN|nr:copper-binding transcription factor [Parelaphostrongylus tenuis]
MSSSVDLIYLHDGSPLFGEEIISPNGKRLTQFLGVPFAEPPIGNLRFRKPKPKQPWRVPLNATIPPNSCTQSFDTYFGEFYGATMWNANTPTSEDCLYMNIFIPGKERKKTTNEIPNAEHDLLCKQFLRVTIPSQLLHFGFVGVAPTHRTLTIHRRKNFSEEKH